MKNCQQKFSLFNIRKIINNKSNNFFEIILIKSIYFITFLNTENFYLKFEFLLTHNPISDNAKYHENNKFKSFN